MMNFLRQTSLVARRELHALLCMPLFYVLSGVFFLLTALAYLVTLVEFAQGSERSSVSVTDSVIVPAFQMIHFFLLVQVPLLTMRTFAEDRTNGMLDLLQTTPLGDWGLLFGKFLGTTGALALHLAVCSVFAITTAMLGQVDWPVVLGCAIALILSSAAYVAIGLLFSVITESQVVAAVLSYVTLFLFAFAGPFAHATGIAAVHDAVRHFSPAEHVNNLLTGNVAPMNVAYFVALTIIFLFATARLLEARRWRA